MTSEVDPLQRALGAAAAHARAEWRADEEHWASAALEQWEHARTLVDRAHEHLHRGDRLSLRWSGAVTALAGRVVEVGDDALVLETQAGRIHVSLPDGVAIGWRVVEHAATGGRSSGAPLTFRARLLELEATGELVEIAAFDDTIVRGAVHVARDHVQVVADDAVWVVALSAVRWVRAAAR